MKTNQSGFGAIEILLVVVTIALIGALGWIAYDRMSDQSDDNQSNTAQNNSESGTKNNEASEQKEAEPITLEAGTFGASNEFGEYGTLQVEGYATTVMRESTAWPPCEGDDCEQEEYVFFNITRTENTNIFPYLEKNSGNAFAQDRAIGIGCLADSKIAYYNIFSSGFDQQLISANNTAAIMAATAENPIILSMEKPQPGPGAGAPSCHTHFATFKIIK